MDFARKQLEKYGWSEGKGLGRNEDGIEAAIKPKLKFDKGGIGHDVGTQFTNNWWEKLFNSAAENLDVEINDNEEVKMKLKSNDSVEITTKSYSVTKLKKDNDLQYGSFLKTAKLTQNGLENYDCSIKPIEPLNNFESLTDEQLFAACGGRTAHKGARHGLKLSGKLSRIEKQEKMLLKKMRKVSISDSDEKEKIVSEKKLKKLKKQKETNRATYTHMVEDSMESVSSNGLKKKNKRKSVSFNETVTKIYTVDHDTSFESEVGSSKDENINEQNFENTASGSDEGIELDIENNNDLVDNHRSFEVVQIKFDDISKAERRKLKKKRKLEAEKNTKTGIFLQKLRDETEEPKTLVELDNKEVNKKKRKFLDTNENDESRRYSFDEESKRYKKHKKKEKRKKKQRIENQKKLMENQLNSIVTSLDSACRISESE